MLYQLSKILDLIASPDDLTATAGVDAVNAENAVIPPPGPITAFQSFTASNLPLPREDADPAPLVCFSCHGRDFWYGSGAAVCRRCHPPAPGAEVPTFEEPTSGTDAPVEIDAGSTSGGAR